VEEFLVKGAALDGFHELVTELGANPHAVLRAGGLVFDALDRDAWISYRAFLNVLELAATHTGCAHFGLLLSQRQDFGMLGVVGFIIREAPDVRTALVELSRYFHTYNQGATVILKVEGNRAILSYDTKLRWVPMYQQFDLAAGVGLNFMRFFCGPQWRPGAVHFPHARPVDVRPYERLFRCPLAFDTEVSGMVFAASELDRKLDHADPALHRLLETHLALVRHSHPDDFQGQVRDLIKQALMTGDCSIERVADYLSINKRTLQRRLKPLGTSFKQLLEDVRFDLATRYLVESGSSLSTLAHMLCYSELSVFSNAFRQRFGVSPREWRRQRVSELAREAAG